MRGTPSRPERPLVLSGVYRAASDPVSRHGAKGATGAGRSMSLRSQQGLRPEVPESGLRASDLDTSLPHGRRRRAGRRRQPQPVESRTSHPSAGVSPERRVCTILHQAKAFIQRYPRRSPSASTGGAGDHLGLRASPAARLLDRAISRPHFFDPAFSPRCPRAPAH